MADTEADDGRMARVYRPSLAFALDSLDTDSMERIERLGEDAGEGVVSELASAVGDGRESGVRVVLVRRSSLVLLLAEFRRMTELGPQPPQPGYAAAWAVLNDLHSSDLRASAWKT